MDDPGLTDLHAFLRDKAHGDLLPWSAQASAAERFAVSLGTVEETVLELGLMPARYQRNRETISTRQQLTLCRSTAVIIGCGGLGGYLIEELARLGVGKLVLIDPDVFEEHNLNRQILSSPAVLNRAKVEVAAERVGAINPAVTVTPLQIALSRENGRDLVRGADVVMDGLDNIPTRVELSRICREMSIPLVHGAIGGWYGHLASQLPGEDISPHLFGTPTAAKGIEAQLGNPSFTPAVVASLQVAEACKILLNCGTCLSGRILYVNLRDMEIVEIRL